MNLLVTKAISEDPMSNSENKDKPACGIGSEISEEMPTPEFWKERLSKERYEVTREKGTERPFSGKYNKYYKDGVYYCSNCGQKLLS